MITRKQKDGVMGYRLMNSGKKNLLQMAEDTFAFYLADGADFSMRKSGATQRLRQHRISETLAIMDKAGIRIDRKEKPPLFEETIPQAADDTQSFFYHPKEVKVQPDLTRKIISSRMTGVYLSEGAVWLCYNIGSELPMWFENVENRADALVRSMLREKGLRFDEAGALLIGAGMEQAKECLGDSKTARYILNSPFHRYCFIPLDEKGALLLRLMDDHETFHSLHSILTEDLQPCTDNWLKHDGYNAAGLPTLICIDCDLKRLIRFIMQLRYQGRYGEVICFDFQKEAIKEYCGEKTKISTVDWETVRRNFLREP